MQQKKHTICSFCSPFKRTYLSTSSLLSLPSILSPVLSLNTQFCGYSFPSNRWSEKDRWWIFFGWTKPLWRVSCVAAQIFKRRPARKWWVGVRGAGVRCANGCAVRVDRVFQVRRSVEGGSCEKEDVEKHNLELFPNPVCRTRTPFIDFGMPFFLIVFIRFNGLFRLTEESKTKKAKLERRKRKESRRQKKQSKKNTTEEKIKKKGKKRKRQSETDAKKTKKRKRWILPHYAHNEENRSSSLHKL